MAEVLLRRVMHDKGNADCAISSAGLGALVGQQADVISRELMQDRDLDITQHKARQLDKNMIRDADLILVMEFAHKIAIEENVPSAKGKVFRLGEWGDFEIPDPYKKGKPAFINVLSLIERGVSEWAVKI